MNRLRIVTGIVAALLTAYAVVGLVGLMKGFDLIAAMLVALSATLAWLGWWFAIWGWKAVRARLKWALVGGIVVGGIGFIIGFFGPLIWAPDANQGPLLGIFITGPIGFVVGAVLGAILGKPRKRDVSTAALVAALLLGHALVPASAPAVMKTAAPVKSTVKLRLLRPGVWIHTSRYVFPDGSVIPSNGLVVREGNGLVLIDTAWGEMLTAELLDEIQREIKLPVRRAIVTHSHADRIAGADLLRQRGIPVYAHPLTCRRAASVAIAMPTDSLALHKPGDAVFVGSVEVFYPGPAHSPDNVVVWVQSARVLFGGCAVKSLDADNLGNLADADTRAWPASLHRVMERYHQAEVVVPGHGAEGRQDLLTHTLELLTKPKP